MDLIQVLEVASSTDAENSWAHTAQEMLTQGSPMPQSTEICGVYRQDPDVAHIMTIRRNEGTNGCKSALQFAALCMHKYHVVTHFCHN